MKEGDRQRTPASDGASESVKSSTDPIVVVVFVVNPRYFHERQLGSDDFSHSQDPDTASETADAAPETSTHAVTSQQYSEELLAEAAKYRLSPKVLAWSRWMDDPRNRPKEAPAVTRYPPPGTYKGGYLQGIRVER